MVLTAQGTPFIHSGQEYGRTKQFRDPAYKTPVAEDKVPNKSHLLRDKDGNPFDYPYFIHDSYDSSDAINKVWRGQSTLSYSHGSWHFQGYAFPSVALVQSNLLIASLES